MNKRFSVIPMTGLVLLTLAGCGNTSHTGSPSTVQSPTTRTSGGSVESNSAGMTTNTTSNPGNTANSVHVSASRSTASQSNYASEIALIKKKNHSVKGGKTTPNATVKTASGNTLTAWITMATKSQDGYSQLVFFFLNGKYLGTDTAKPSLEITSAKAVGHGIAVTYPVYKKSDSFANPTGAPVTITYTWNGSKLVPDKPYPKQFQASNTATESKSSISTKSYSTSAKAAAEIASIQGSSIGTGAPTVALGNGVTAKASGAMGHARWAWHEGNWTIQFRFYTRNTGMKEVANNMVSYLHSHMLPAPKNHGVIIVNSTSTSTTFKPQTTIAWQEGAKVSELKQTGDPVQALQTVVNHK